MVHILNIYTISAFVALAGVLYGFGVASTSGVICTNEYKSYCGNPLGTRQSANPGAIAPLSVHYSPLFSVNGAQCYLNHLRNIHC
ncbi:hypothetical protein V1505DRAFT_67617 [Lipomyces doorenjongii]